ncbi:MAG TPA: Ku protein [Thermoanaerobaculia bacterium]|nr:Ku protein [Thermoanaerobaculia bacterium]
MAARAIWKGEIKIGKSAVPVKLYSAVQDKSVHFRLLHKTDKAPVKQKMVNPETEEEVPYQKTQKAFPLGRGRLVLLDEEDLESISPEPSRDIEITRFVDPADIDHRWYERPYYLGPDGNTGAYFALAAALGRKKKEGIARWVMRGKEYIGALVEEDGYLMLITLRNAEEVIDAEALKPPAGRALQKRELQMAGQLVAALSGHFDPTQYRDEYRARVMELVETRARGGKVQLKVFRPKKTDDDRLGNALEASLAGVKKKGA